MKLTVLLLITPAILVAGMLDPTEVTIGRVRLNLPQINHYARLDGKSDRLDATVNQMAAGGRNRVMALYGTEKDLGLVLQGSTPKLERSVCLQTAIRFENMEMPIEIWPRFKEAIKGDIGKPSSEIAALLNEVEIAAGDALTRRDKLMTHVMYNHVVPLGVFAETSNSLCHSVLAKVSSVADGHPIEAVQACGIAVVYCKGKIVTFYSYALYKGADDLKWCRDIVLQYRDEFLKLNAP